ncbi:hypothetical protein SAMN05660836_01749 [Thermodesulforhabdus norvegica]|uniref:Uncharacterized protein n=1 Tax=Thermodesulforhabdus norvegica TaxID=39841 RepID=A0A1I4UAK1_9BACT|nr:hypothetical protein SAMN05660836_01749 [Thermodesulforhabdus norvegica]
MLFSDGERQAVELRIFLKDQLTPAGGENYNENRASLTGP